MTEIERITEELGKAIHDSEEYLAYEAARRNYDESERLQALTGEFNLKKMAVLHEMQKPDGERDEAKIKTMQDELRAVYTQLAADPLTEDYEQKKNALEEVVNGIYRKINFYVTGQEPHSCSGNCGGCAGCH